VSVLPYCPHFSKIALKSTSLLKIIVHFQPYYTRILLFFVRLFSFSLPTAAFPYQLTAYLTLSMHFYHVPVLWPTPLQFLLCCPTNHSLDLLTDISMHLLRGSTHHFSTLSTNVQYLFPIHYPFYSLSAILSHNPQQLLPIAHHHSLAGNFMLVYRPQSSTPSLIPNFHSSHDCRYTMEAFQFLKLIWLSLIGMHHFYWHRNILTLDLM
jgi:hypothetical protein